MRIRVFFLLLCVAGLNITFISPESEAKPKSDVSLSEYSLCGCKASHPPGVLKDFFPDLDFERVWMFTPGLLTPLMHCLCIEGMAIDHCILIRPEHSLETPYSLGIVAHELKHVEQWKEIGAVRFIIRYSLEFIRGCYTNSKYEKEAREVQKVVEEAMS